MHLTEARLAETDQTVDELAHLQSCVRCQVAALSLNSFLDDTSPSIVAPEAQRYTAVRSLGAGGMSHVVLSVDERLGREVARKKLRTVTSARDLERFVREASITARLEHPNIVPVYDLELDPQGSPTLTMRVVRGTSLGEAMRTGALPDRRARLEVFLKVCDAVAFAHSRGIVHRDLKPDNVMVGEFGEVQVVDFGLAAQEAIEGDAAASASAMLTRMGTVMGTPAYMSPEAARADLDRVGPASDVYGLGATLWEIATGRPPFTGEADAVVAEVALGRVPSPKDVDPSVPEDLVAIVLRAMATDPRDRYLDVQALRRDVVSFLEHAPVSARVPTIADRLANWFARNRATVMPVAATAVLAVAVLIAGLVTWARQATTARDELARQVEASETARLDAQHALANALLTEAHANVTEHPGTARTALIEARRVGSETQQRAATLALDGLAGSTPTEVLRLPTGNVGQRIEVRPDGLEAAIVGIDGSIRRCSLPDGKETGRWDPVPEGDAQGAGWLDDGRWVRLNRVGRRVTVTGADDAVIASFDADVPSGTEEIGLEYGDEVAVGVLDGGQFLRVYSLEGRLVREGEAYNSLFGRGGPDGRAQVHLDVDRGVLESRGRPLWRGRGIDWGRGIDSLLAVLPDRFVVRDHTGLVAYRYGDARELWRVPSTAAFTGEALDGLIAVSTMFQDGEELAILRASDGSDVTHLGLGELGRDLGWSSPLHLLLAPTGDAMVGVPVGSAANWPAPIIKEGARSVAISPDGAFVAVGFTKVVVLSRATRRVLFDLPVHDADLMRGLRFLDTRHLAIACRHGVVVMDLADGSARTTATSVPVMAIDGTGGGGWVAVRDDGRLITSEDDVAVPARTLHTGVISDVAVQGDVVLTSGRDKADMKARAWALPSLAPLWVSDRLTVYWGVDATPTQAAFVDEGGRLRVHELRLGQLAWEVQASRRVVFGVAIDDDGTIFTTGVDGEVAAWREGEPLGRWRVNNYAAMDVAASMNVVVAAFGEGTLWWLERGLHDRISAPGALAIARRWLAAHVPEEAARQMAAAPRQDLLPHERALLVEMGIDPPTALTGAPFDDGSIAVWQHWLDR